MDNKLIELRQSLNKIEDDFHNGHITEPERFANVETCHRKFYDALNADERDWICHFHKKNADK